MEVCPVGVPGFEGNGLTVIVILSETDPFPQELIPVTLILAIPEKVVLQVTVPVVPLPEIDPAYPGEIPHA